MAIYLRVLQKNQLLSLHFHFHNQATFQLIVQVIMNLAVVIGLIPVTGVSLPFLSYGGSSLLTSLVGIGIILNIARESN